MRRVEYCCVSSRHNTSHVPPRRQVPTDWTLHLFIGPACMPTSSSSIYLATDHRMPDTVDCCIHFPRRSSSPSPALHPSPPAPTFCSHLMHDRPFCRRTPPMPVPLGLRRVISSPIIISMSGRDFWQPGASTSASSWSNQTVSTEATTLDEQTPRP